MGRARGAAAPAPELGGAHTRCPAPLLVALLLAIALTHGLRPAAAQMMVDGVSYFTRNISGVYYDNHERVRA